MNHLTCSHIRKNGSICNRVCTCLAECSLHWKSSANNMLKSPCRICDKPTLSYTVIVLSMPKKFIVVLRERGNEKIIIALLRNCIFFLYSDCVVTLLKSKYIKYK